MVSLSMDAQTPPDDGEIVGQYGEKEEMAQAGLGGAGLTEGERLANIAAASAAQAFGGAIKFRWLTGQPLMDRD